MIEEFADSNKQAELYKTLFNESIIPMGILRAEESNPSSDFKVQTANKSFLAISHIKNPTFPIAVQEAFSFLNNFNSSLIHQKIKSSNHDSCLFYYETDGKHFRFTLKKLTAVEFSFTLEEITELQQKKLELREKDYQLKESQEIAQLGYWIENHEKEDNYWSEQFYSILGIPVKNIEPSFTNYLQFVFPEDFLKVNESYQECIDTKTGFQLTHRLLLNGGQIKFVNLRCYTKYNTKGEPAQTIGILQDVSAFEITKEALRKSELIFRSIFENAPIAIVLVNSKFQPIYANQQFSDITGYSMDEVLKKELKDFTFPDDFENNANQYVRLFNNEISSFSLTKRYIQKNGNIIWVKIIVSAIKDKNNNTTSAIAMVQDISAEKKASESLLKSEYKYRTLIENANDGIGLFNLDFKPIIYNTALYNMLGYTLEEYLQIDHNNFGLFHSEDIHLGKEALLQLKNNSRIKIEARLRNNEGNYQYFSISYIPVLHEEKQAILIFRSDISKRKKAEHQNEEYRLFLETIMNNIPVLFFAKTTPDFKYLYWNNAAEQITGILADDTIGKTDFEVQPSKTIAEKYFQDDLKLLKFKKKLESEHEYTNANGEIKHFKTIKTLHQSPTGTPIILGLSMDITQLKEAEQQIEQSTQMLKEAQKIARLGYWEYDVAKDLFFDNPENRQILGTDILHYFLNSAQFKDLLVPEDQEEVMNAFYKCIATNTSGKGIIRIQPNNETRHIAINYRPITNEKNEVIKLRGTCLDITNIRRSELALRESEKRLKQAEHIAKVGYWDHNYITKETHFSHEIWNILDIPFRNAGIKFSDFVDTIHPEDKVAASIQFQKSTQTNQSFDFDFRIITRNQNIKFIKAIGTFVKNSQGELQRSIGTFQDVSAFRKTELELKKNTENLIQIQKLSKTGYIEISLQSNSVVFCDSMYDLLEVSSLTPLTLDIYQSMIQLEDKEMVERTIQNTVKSKSNHTLQYRIKLTSGKIKYISEIGRISKSYLTGDEFAIRIIQDITQIKEKELELFRWRDIKKSTAIGTWEFSLLNENYILNTEAYGILDLDEKQPSIGFSEWIKRIHPEDKFSVEVILNDSFRNQKNFTLTYRIINPKNNEIKYIQDSSSFHHSPNGKINLIGTIRDITKIRQTEQQLLENHELLQAITQNSSFSIAIIQHNKHLYVNNQWCKLIGMESNEVINKLTINEIYQPATTHVIIEILLHWKKYGIKEYQNELIVKPINAAEFKAEIFVKEIVFNHSMAFLVLLNPQL